MLFTLDFETVSRAVSTYETPVVEVRLACSKAEYGVGEQLVGAINFDSDIPGSFFKALEEFKQGRVIDLDIALEKEPPPADQG